MASEVKDPEVRSRAEANPASQPASPSVDLPGDALILIPVRNLVLFPGLIVPISVGRDFSVAGAQEAARSGRQIGIVLQRQPETDLPGREDLHDIGTAATILRYVTVPDGSHHVICQGEQRFRILELLPGFAFTVARVERYFETAEQSPEIQARVIQLKERSSEVLRLLPQAPAELVSTAQNINSAAALCDFIAGLLDLEPEEKQDVLETIELQARLDKVLEALARRIQVLELSREIGEQTKERLEERNREALLREQLRTIQKELGEGEGLSAEIGEIAEGIALANDRVFAP